MKKIFLSAKVVGLVWIPKFVFKKMIYKKLLPYYMKMCIRDRCIGGAIGGAITGAAGAGTVAAVALSIYTFPVYLGAGFGGLMLGCVVGGLITFVLTYLMGIDEKENA